MKTGISTGMFQFFLNLGHRCRSADVHGNDAYCSSGVVMDTERVKPTVSAGWCQEGHPAHKTSHQNPLFNS